jgi:cytidyltransferase-like protein
MKDKHSLFVGRWQPFHKGHKTLIETVLKKDKPVIIAIRDTEISKENPYSATERWTMIQNSLRQYGSLVKIVTIPDIDEICYGRDVGYEIRRIDLDDKIQKISGTKIRESTSTNTIIWITGQSNSGKTTLANTLQQKIGGVILDGDELRKSVSLGLGFSKYDRNKHNLRIARLAKSLSKFNPVIISVIAPFERTRTEITKILDPIWVYIKRDLPKEKNKPYEIPKHPHIVVDSDIQTLDEEIRCILNFLNK